MESISCKICNSNNTHAYFLGNTELIKCANCDIVYNKNTSIEEENKYYKENYTLRKNTISLQSELRRLSRFPEQLKLIADINHYKKTPANLTDIGCDKGYFIDDARRFGYTVYGVELSEDARKYTTQLNLNVFDDIKQVTEKTDVVTMWHSLEHFSEPQQFLKELHQQLNNEAYLFIRVPDFGCFFSKILRHKWRWFQPHNHYFHYTKKSLTKMFELAGYKVIKCVSQDPSNHLTDAAFDLADDTLRQYFNEKASLRYKLGTIYERYTCRELYLIATNKK